MSPATRWISIIVGLLAGNAIAVFVLIGAAGGDTERRVLPDYYARAAAWDATMAEAAASARLGWSGVVTARGREVELSLLDGRGAPLSDATVSVRGLPRGRADEVREVALVAVAPGRYRGTWPGARHGLHRLAVVAERGGERWVADRVVELAGTAAP